jgi:hypothetical protein
MGYRGCLIRLLFFYYFLKITHRTILQFVVLPPWLEHLLNLISNILIISDRVYMFIK